MTISKTEYMVRVIPVVFAVMVALLVLPHAAEAGFKSYYAPGIYNFLVPAGVTQLLVSGSGVGGTGGLSYLSPFDGRNYSGGGGGSAGSVINKAIPVVAGSTYQVIVGGGSGTSFGSLVTLTNGQNATNEVGGNGGTPNGVRGSDGDSVLSATVPPPGDFQVPGGSGANSTFASGGNAGYIGYDVMGDCQVDPGGTGSAGSGGGGGGFCHWSGRDFDSPGGSGGEGFLELSWTDTGVGTIAVSTNLASASWTITGPATLNGSGLSQTYSSQPVGSYTITWNPVAGYNTPAPQTLPPLTNGGTITFNGGIYSPATASCNLPWGGTVAHGGTVAAYQSPSVVSPASCVSESRVCNNGTLSGTYTNQSCTTITNGACGSANGSSYASQPATNLCSAGNIAWTDATAADGTYNWNCAGINGGTTASCVANKVSFACSARPANSTFYAGDDTSLAANTASTYNVANTAAKCEFICNANYWWNGGACVLPDLTAVNSGPVANASFTTAQAITFTGIAQNSAAAPIIEGGWGDLEIDWGANGSQDANYNAFGGAQLGAFAQSQGKTLSYSFAPGTVPVGTHQYRFNVDVTNSLSESSEANRSPWVKFSVTAPAATGCDWVSVVQGGHPCDNGVCDVYPCDISGNVDNAYSCTNSNAGEVVLCGAGGNGFYTRNSCSCPTATVNLFFEKRQ